MPELNHAHTKILSSTKAGLVETMTAVLMNSYSVPTRHRYIRSDLYQAREMGKAVRYWKHIFRCETTEHERVWGCTHCSDGEYHIARNASHL